MANETAISFSVSKADRALIFKIVDRGVELAGRYDRQDLAEDRTGLLMDVTACHANGCPLKLQALLSADDFNFAHDFFGINRHLDRETGGLMNCFLPRFAA